MDTQTAISELESIIGQRQNEIDALNTLLTLVKNGYQTDQATITAAVAAAKDAAAAALTAAASALTPTPAPAP